MLARFAMAAIAILMATSAFAQSTAKPANNDASTPAVAMPDTTNSGAPVAGANSFTEAQVRERLSKAGYTGVSSLSKDKKGVWRGKAMKAGNSTDVALDYQGNITAQ